MTEQSKQTSVPAAEALRILEEAWAYFDLQPRKPAREVGGYDLPSAA